MAIQEQKLTGNRQTEEQELLQERYALAVCRIGEIEQEHLHMEAYDRYFRFVAGFLQMMDETYQMACEGGIRKGSMEELSQ